MKRSETGDSNSIQQRLMKPFTGKVKAKNARASIVNAGFAISSLILDTSVPISVIRRDLEDIKETIDFAIDIMASQRDAKLVN